MAACTIVEFDTNFLEQKFTMDWEILNFDCIPYGDFPSVKSPFFKMGNKYNNCKWRFCVYKKVTQGEESIGFRMLRENRDFMTWSCVKFSVYIGAGPLKQMCFDKIIVANSGANPTNFFRSSEFDEDKATIIHAKDVIVSSCITYVFQDNKIPVELEDKEASLLMNDMELLCKNRRFSDITLVAGSAKIPANKCILESRGFRKGLIAGDTLELCLEEHIAIALVDCIYSGKLPETASEVSELLSAARKYELECVIVPCINFLRVRGISLPVYEDEGNSRKFKVRRLK